jgi:hypothetical protein
MSHTDMGIVGATTDSFILFENGVRRNRLALPGLSNAADHMPSKPVGCKSRYIAARVQLAREED